MFFDTQTIERKGEAVKPTVIGSGEEPNKPKTVKPTVIPTQLPSQPKTQEHKPSVIPVGVGDFEKIPLAPTPITVTPNDRTITTKPIFPTRIVGAVERQRIQVNSEELRKRNPGVKTETLDVSVGLIQATNLDDITDRDVILWGSDLQRIYTDLVTESLALVQSPILSKVRSYIGRMMEILSLIDLKKVCGLEETNRSLFSFLTQEGKRIDTLSKLSDAQVELTQLIAKLGVKLTELLDLKEQLEKLSSKIEAVGQKVEASAIAASFLSDYIRTQKANVVMADRFADRSMSLTETLVQIRSGDSIRETQVEQPLVLIGSVQHVANVLMPGWLGSVVGLKTILEQRRKPTVTEVDDLGDQTGKILEELKGR